MLPYNIASYLPQPIASATFIPLLFCYSPTPLATLATGCITAMIILMFIVFYCQTNYFWYPAAGYWCRRSSTKHATNTHTYANRWIWMLKFAITVTENHFSCYRATAAWGQKRILPENLQTSVGLFKVIWLKQCGWDGLNKKAVVPLLCFFFDNFCFVSPLQMHIFRRIKLIKSKAGDCRRTS